MIKGLLTTAILMLSIKTGAQQVIAPDIIDGHRTFKNYIINPSATKNLRGTATSSAGLTRDTDVADRIDGVASFNCDTTALNGFCEWDTTTIFAPDTVGNCEASVSYKGDASLYSLRVTDGTNTLRDLALGNAADWTRAAINYPCGTTRDIRLVQTTAGTSPAVNVGRIYWGPATNVGLSAQAEWYGAISTVSHTQATTATINTWLAFPATSVVYAAPQGRVTAIPGNTTSFGLRLNGPGEYLVIAYYYMDTTGSPIGCYQGLARAASGAQAEPINLGLGRDLINQGGSVQQRFSVTSGSQDVYLSLYQTVANTCRISSGASVHFQVYRFPTQSEIAVRSDQALDTLGSVFYVAGSQCPVGSLLADGSAVSRTTFGNLFQRLGTTHGAGDGSTTFNLPDLRGIFVRGTGSQTVGGQVYSGTLGTKQTDQFQGHEHNIQARQNNVGTSGTHSYQAGTDVVARNTAGIISDGVNGTPRVGTQTHPANIALTPCISIATAQAPLLVGSVTSNSTGLERVERARINCSGSSSITRQSGNWISSVGNISAGYCTVTIAAGIFSGPPTCVPTLDGVDAALVSSSLQVDSATQFQVGCRFVATGSSTVQSCTTPNFHILCQGPR